MPKTKGIAYIMMHLVQSTLGLFLNFYFEIILQFGRVAKTAQIVSKYPPLHPALPNVNNLGSLDTITKTCSLTPPLLALQDS